MMPELKPNTAASSEEFEFSALTAAVNYRHAIIEVFRNHLTGDVIEHGAGIGQISELVTKLPRVSSFLAVEPDGRYARRFSERLPGVPLHSGFLESLPQNTPCNTILSVNVFEHIDLDINEMAVCRQFLAKSQGTLCLLVPARPELYSQIDRDFGHFRRYTRLELKQKLLQAGFSVEKLEYFSLVGYLTWLVNFKLLGARQFDVRKLKVFDRWIFPLARRLEKLIGSPPVGQSLIVIARATFNQ